MAKSIKDKKVSISATEYARLERDSRFLESLYGFGLESWEFFDDATKDFEQGEHGYPDEKEDINYMEGK